MCNTNHYIRNLSSNLRSGKALIKLLEVRKCFCVFVFMSLCLYVLSSLILRLLIHFLDVGAHTSLRGRLYGGSKDDVALYDQCTQHHSLSDCRDLRDCQHVLS